MKYGIKKEEEFVNVKKYENFKKEKNSEAYPTNNDESDETNLEEIKRKYKDIKEMKTYFEQSNPKLAESLEILDFRDSGGESNVYTILISIKQKEKMLQKKAIMKVIFLNKRKKEKDNIQEYLISTRLKSQNIINSLCISKIKEDESTMILMDDSKYGNFRNFQRLIKRNVLSETMIAFFGYQIFNGIKYMHACKIAHMDIKLKNIVIDENLMAKLIDFSISINYKGKKPDDEIELPSHGTHFYIPKEVYLLKKVKTKNLQKIDLYAFGVVLYNLAFGCYPYGLIYGDKTDVELKKITEGKLEFKSNNYSSYFLDFLTKLLEKDINKRIDIKEAENHYWLKGGSILLDEKEKMYNLGEFTSYMLTDYFKSFNDYMNKQKLDMKNEEDKFI